MPRSPARRRVVPRDSTPGKEFHWGPKVYDDVTGDLVPERLTVIDQWGRRVSARRADDSLDKSDEY